VAFIPVAMLPAEFDLHFADYPAALAAAGALPVELARDADVSDMVSRLDALVLSGGADIDPAFYGAEPAPGLGDIEPDRDVWELALIHAALEQNVPILAICRGAQLLNVALGGTLVQHVDLTDGVGHPRFDDDRSLLCHRVVTVAGSMANHVFGDSIQVNSLHHQVLDQLGDGLVATGHAEDGVVETIELPGHPVLAVQWHPEMLAQPNPAISWLVATARSLASAR
jgi:putative glutamine amidotransferase